MLLGEDEVPEEKERSGMCKVCNKNKSIYCCPRCNLNYCSLTCYKNHSKECTTSFHQEALVNALKGEKASDADRTQMLQILKRVGSSASPLEELEALEDEEEKIDQKLTQTLENLQLGADVDETLLASLPVEEREAFERDLKEGKLSELIDVWTPWWFPKKISTEEDADKLPEILEDLQPISKLCKTKPSELLMFNLVEILYCYCFCLRLHNGELQSDSLAGMFLSLSKVLTENLNFPSTTEVLLSVVERSVASKLNDESFSIAILGDVAQILQSLDFILRALSQSYCIFDEAETEKKISKKLKKTIMNAKRKLYFYLCWINSTRSLQEKFLGLAVKIELLKTKQFSALKDRTSRKAPPPSNPTLAEPKIGKPVITELGD